MGESVKKASWTFIFFLAALVVAPLFIAILLGLYFYGLWLNYQFRSKWKSHDKHILFVYSESPNWQLYIEQNIVPRIEDEAVFLNWSKRSEWKKSKPLEAKILSHWGGGSEFNPMAIVFMPRGKIKTVRFYQAFKDFKHGNSDLLRRKEAKLYSYLESSGTAGS